MAAVLKKELGIESELVRGSGGIFEVTAGKARVFSKQEEGRFPTEVEIVERLRTLAVSS